MAFKAFLSIIHALKCTVTVQNKSNTKVVQVRLVASCICDFACMPAALWFEMKYILLMQCKQCCCNYTMSLLKMQAIITELMMLFSVQFNAGGKRLHCINELCKIILASAEKENHPRNLACTLMKKGIQLKISMLLLLVLATLRQLCCWHIHCSNCAVGACSI